MNNKNEDLYTIVNSSLLKKLGDNASTLSELLLFDNIAGNSEGEGVDAEFFFSQKLIKLGADIILICLSGSVKYIIDCNRTINLNPGEFSFHKEGDIIDFVDANMESKIILILLPHDIGMIQYFKDKIINNYSTVISPTPEIFEEICAVYRMMKKKMDEEKFSMKEEIVYSYLISILFLLYDAMNKSESSKTYANFKPDHRQMDLYNKFVKSVKTNYMNHREVAFYASDICISPGHLARIVKNVSGKTVSEWIKDYVILEAKVMLRLKKLAIYQISESLSFPNPSFFSKYFREKEGISPSQYRDSIR